MTQAGRKSWKKLPAAVLASVVVLGTGASTLPFASSVQAEEYTAAATTAPNVSDPAKMELIYLVGASITSQNRFAQTSDHMEYWAVEAAQNQAMDVVSNPDPNSAQLFAARQKIEKAWEDYAYRYVHDKQDVQQILGRDGRAIHSSDPAELSPWEQGVVNLIDETYDLMATMGDSHAEAAKAYQYYELRLAKLSRLSNFNLDFYSSSLSDNQQNILPSLAQLQQLGIDVTDRKANFDRSVAFMQALLNNGPYEKAVYSAALNDVQNDRYAIMSSAELAGQIARLQKLADTAPRGTASGQYPASSFGTLNRAINEAKRVLKNADSSEELNYQYQFVLERAEYYFKKSVKP
ncbi:hypothetical protein CDO73_17515 [Saccharibacillus sp. O23]|uniref:hypothetical protein n=1 Tax=Saccharibacillus sp. O23 TaxID=2009338 RepID=UPI000B4E0F58|nr:hypothetical protein [Saccharibacillus sp. O23]OWR28697.1 hypothetical protein CDO73_17515 [Saccharibacillus sp. O23]